MAKRKQPKELKVNTIFTPVQDYQARLRRVLALLLCHSAKAKEDEDANS